MIKIKKKNPYRKYDVSPEDAYKFGEVLELIYQLEILSRKNNIDRDSTLRGLNCSRYMNKLSSQLSVKSKEQFTKGQDIGAMQAFELFDILSKKELKNYQKSLIEEVEQLKFKNNL